MGHRYYATVTFPAAAGKIPEVRAWLDSEDNEYFEIYEGATDVEVSHSEANYGAIGVTELLDKHRVPYDHYHSEGGDGGSYTCFIRWPVGAARVAGKLLAEPDKNEIELSEANEEVFMKASNLLEIWNNKKLGARAVRAELERMKALLPEPLDLEWKLPLSKQAT
jgi:hypothetical protein